MITLYLLSRGSTSVSRNSIPSVIYLIRVRSLLLRSSKRIVYPTYFPNMSAIQYSQRQIERAHLVSEHSPYFRGNATGH